MALSGPRLSWGQIKVKRAEAKAMKELERNETEGAEEKRGRMSLGCGKFPSTIILYLFVGTLGV